jgi:hypothetical protein
MKNLSVAILLISSCLSVGFAQTTNTKCGSKILPGTSFSLAKGAASDVNLASESIVDLPIAFHIVSAPGSIELNPNVLPGVISSLNAAFAQAKIQFFQYSVDYFGDYIWGSNGPQSDSEDDQLSLINRVDFAINIYFHPGYRYGGTGTFTSDLYPARQVASIIYINGAVGTSVIPHEMGHYFNVFHTFETGVGYGRDYPEGPYTDPVHRGDLIYDTYAEWDIEADRGADNFDGLCLYNKATWIEKDGIRYYYNIQGLNATNAKNFMTYAPVYCRTEFTPTQNTRLRTQLSSRRPELLKRWIRFANLASGSNAGGSLKIDNTTTIGSGSYLKFDDVNQHVVKTLNERFGSNKHHDWNLNVNEYFLLKNFTPPSEIKRQWNEANFVSLASATVRNVFSGSLSGRFVDFRDPWYVDASGNQPNSFVTFQAPFSPTGAYGQSTGGVFTGQDVADPNPYYSVRAFEYWDMEDGFTWKFNGWTSTNAQVTSPASLESPVKFTGTDAEVKANYTTYKPYLPSTFGSPQTFREKSCLCGQIIRTLVLHNIKSGEGREVKAQAHCLPR